MKEKSKVVKEFFEDKKQKFTEHYYFENKKEKLDNNASRNFEEEKNETILIKRNLNAKNHCEIINPFSYEITKPTIICFGGNAVTKTENANGFAKIASNLLGIRQERENLTLTAKDVDILSFSYKANPFGIGYIDDEELSKFSKTLFQPLYQDKNGKILSEQDILKNFNKVNFFCYSFGAKACTDLLRETSNNMIDAGLSFKTIDNAIDQIFAVSYAPIEKCVCPNIGITSLKDNLYQSTIPTNSKSAEQLAYYLRGCPKSKFENDKINEERLKSKAYEHGTTGTVAFKENNLSLCVLTSGMVKDNENASINNYAEHDSKFIKRDENWQYTQNNPEFGEEVSGLTACILAKVVGNSIKNQNEEIFTPKPTTDELLQDAKTLLGETQNVGFLNAITEIQNNPTNFIQ